MKKLFFLFLLLPIICFSQTTQKTVWISLENLDETAILSNLNEEINKSELINLNDPIGKNQAAQIEMEARKTIQQEEQEWQSHLMEFCASVSNAYNKKVEFENSYAIALEDLSRLKMKLEDCEKQIQLQQATIQNSKNAQNIFMQEFSNKLKTTPFYVVFFGSAEYEPKNKTIQDIEKVIFANVRKQAVEAVKASYINVEAQIEQYQPFTEHICDSISGQVQVEQTTSNPYIVQISSFSNKISVVGLLAVNPWLSSEIFSIQQPQIHVTNMEFFPIENSTITRLSAYPSAFAEDAQKFLEKSRSQNMNFLYQIKLLVSNFRSKLDQEDKFGIKAKEYCKRLEIERAFYQQELLKRQSEKIEMENQLASMEDEFRKANFNYQAFLKKRFICQFQSDLMLNDSTQSSEQMYSNIINKSYKKFRENMREDFLNWVVFVNFNQLIDYQESRRNIPAKPISARILYRYMQNNFDGGSARGLLIVFKAQFDMSEIQDYPPCKKMTTSENDSIMKTPNEEGIEWVFVQKNTFQMGSNEKEFDEKPEHSVTLNDFYISKYEVTNEQYALFLNTYGSEKVKFGEYAGQIMVYEHNWGVKKLANKWQASAGYEKYPVVYVTWCGANEFCKFYGYRLPTEAEWEYAARGGSQRKGYVYSGSNNLIEVAWYDRNSTEKTHEVGKKLPNELGLYDMSGNVWEWCNDWYDSYNSVPQDNPTGPLSGTNRVLRGGSWFSISNFCRVTYRFRYYPFFRYNYFGFRCVKTK